MTPAKLIADLLTLTRLGAAILLVVSGLMWHAESLPLAAWLLLFSWTTDLLDGPIARRSPVEQATGPGEHDLEIDILVSIGLLLHMWISGFVNPLITWAYLTCWAIVFFRWGIPRSLGLLIQAPIYGWFLLLALRLAPAAGLWLVIWILVVITITWPRFPQEVVPGFLDGLRAVLSERPVSRH